MCGIAGFSGRYDAALLGAMSDCLAHRGPDDSGARLLEGPSSRVGFAHRRLSIIDLSAEAHEPMGVECGSCGIDAATEPSRARWLTYNGEIYNYRELRHELEQSGHHFHSQSDAEVLLHLYSELGTAMLSRLDGMFAFALYDGRGNRDGVAPGAMLVARDGFGVKPFYYAETGNGFLFASELKAILLAPDVPRELDYLALHEYIAYLWSPAPRTPLIAVRKLPPGQAMVIADGRIVRQWTFYDLPYGAEALLDEPENVIAERVQETFAAAVDRQMVSDVPVGAFLSGGLDSSSIVAMMRRRRPHDAITCYSIGFEGDDELSDSGSPADLPFARIAAAKLGVDLRILQLDSGMISNLERMIYHLDEPQADPAPINSMLIAEAARRDGIKVLMSGTGGDDVFSGYRRHVAVRFEPLWSWLPMSARKRLAAMATSIAAGGGPSGGMSSSLGRRLAKTFSYADRPDDERTASYFYWSVETLRRSLYSRDFAAATAGYDTATPLLASLGRIPGERDALNRMLYLEGKHFLADHNLNYADKTTMAAGVETRVPFLDGDLVRLATRIPSRMKQKGRTGKAILKKAMEPMLPREIIYRPKTGFGAPVRRWLKDELRPMADQLLSPAVLRSRGLFDPAAVQRLRALDSAGRVDGSYTIFALLCIEIWCGLFLDGKSLPAAGSSPAVEVMTGPR